MLFLQNGLRHFKIEIFIWLVFNEWIKVILFVNDLYNAIIHT